MSNRGLEWLKEAALDRELPSVLYPTLFLIWYECWDSDNTVHWSRPSTIPELAKEWGLHRGTVWRHIEKLVQFGWIDVKRIKETSIRLRPSEDAINMRIGRDPATSGREVAPGGVFNLKDNIKDISIEESTTTVAEPRRGREVATEQIEFVDPPEDFQDRLEMLTKAGIYSSAAAVIADKEHATIEYIQNWINYIKCDRDRGIGFAVRRMSDGDLSPEYCLTCGGIGGNHSWVITEKDGSVECPKEYWNSTESEMVLQFGKIRWDRRIY